MVEEKDIKRGFVYYDDLGKITVMAVADGHCMCRRPGKIPFATPVNLLTEALNAGVVRTDANRNPTKPK